MCQSYAENVTVAQLCVDSCIVCQQWADGFFLVLHYSLCSRFYVCWCVFFCAKSKRQYEKSHRESEKALDAFRKSDADIHLSRADVEKVSASVLFQAFCV